MSAEEFPDTSLKDPVTGLYNRKHLLQRLEANISRCSRGKERLALILWDIDGFVDFNNTFGQQEGDRFLKKVAETVKSCLRPYDEAFRAGADEFCALLVPSDDKIAQEVTNRVRDRVVKNLFQGESEYKDRHFSISFGHVFFPGEDKMPEALLYAAGQALYKNRMAKVGL